MFGKIREMNLFFMENFRPVIYFFWFTLGLCFLYFVFGRTVSDVIWGSFLMFVLAFSCGVIYMKSQTNIGVGISFLFYVIIGFFVFYNTLVPTLFTELDKNVNGFGVYVVDNMFEKRCQLEHLNNEMIIKYGDSAIPWYKSLETKNIDVYFPSYQAMMGSSCIFEVFYDECVKIKGGVSRINDYDYYIDYYKLERERYDLFYCDELLNSGINQTGVPVK